MNNSKIRKILFLYKFFFHKYTYIQVIKNIMTIILIGLSLIQPILDQQLIDNVLVKKDISKFPYIIVIYIAVSIVVLYTSIIIQKKNIEVDIDSNKNIKSKLIEYILNNSKFDLSKKSDVVISLTNDSNNIINFFNNTLWAALLNILNIIIMVFYLCMQNINLTLIILLNAILQLFFINHFSKQYLINYEKSRDNSEKQFRYFDSTFINFRIIKSFNYESKNYNKYIPILEEYGDINKSNFNIYKNQNILTTGVAVTCTSISIILGVQYVLSNIITLGVYVVFLSYGERLKYSMNNILENIKTYKTIDVSLNRISYHLENSHKIKGEEQNHIIEEIDEIQTIELRNIQFRYEDKIIFDKYNACYKADNLYFLLGENGSGKSTLVELLLQNQEPNSGDILLNGINIKHINPEFIREKISVSFQDEYFINDSILNNITMGNSAINLEKLDKVLSITRCHDFIKTLKDGINTNMDEIENKFSIGELQKLCIARTLMKESDVYIFDESVSNIDNETKHHIINGIKEYLQKKIVLFITHDKEIIDKKGWITNTIVKTN